MDSQLGAPVGECLPDHVRAELTDVDRLRTVWAEHRRHQTPKVRAAARRALTHDRVQGWGGGPELTELLSAEPAGAEPPLTESSIAELAARVAALSFGPGVPPTPLPDEHTRALAEAVRLPAHPVVRAAHAYAECARLLTEFDDGPADPPNTPASGPVRVLPRVLPWVLASRVLQRADHPPLALDPRTPPPEPRTGQDADRHLVELVSHFARLATEALRWEIGWSPDPETDLVPAGPVPPLAAATRRRVLNHVRSRSASVALILRALDPHSRAVVTWGDGGHDKDSTASRRGLLTPGTAYWWTRLDLVLGDTSLTLRVVVQDVGSPPSGVLAITANAYLATPTGVRETLEMSGSDSVTVMPSDSVDDRWPQVRDLVDEAISRSMNELTRA